jgi:type I restriction enzyme S subunit
MEIDLCVVAPRDWEIRSVADVCERVTSGGTPSRREPAFYEGGTWPWVKTQELQDGWIDNTEEHITDRAINESSAKVLPANTILLAMYGATVGQLGILRRPMTCNQACCALIADPQKADFRFLYYQLLQIRSELKSLATGAAQQNLSGTVIKSLRLPFPKIQEQRAIAQILGTLDDKIELNRKQNETLEAMARALFKAWFVDFEPVRAKMEGRWQRGQSLPGLPAHIYDLFPDRLVESELGEMPEGWKYAPLSEFIEILDSRRVPLSGKQRAERRGIYPYHGAAGVMDFVDDYLFEGIHVLIGEDGSVVKDDGRPYTQYVWGKFWVNNHAHVLRGRGITNETLLIFLDQCDIAPFVTGAVQPKLSQGNLKKIPFIDAGEQLLNGFGEAISPLFKKIRDATEELRALVQIRDTLLPKLISGELRVPDVDKFMEAMA